MSDVSDLFWTKRRCDRANVPFNIIIGGRGTGKTYTCLRDAYLENFGRFIYMRRLDSDIDTVCGKGNPFKALNDDFGWNVYCRNENKVSVFYEKREGRCGGTEKTDGGNCDTSVDNPYFCGYICSLSVFSRLRGVSFSDVDTIIFDEFIKETSQRNTIKDEADAFFNAYETINRNREIDFKTGQIIHDPVKVYLLSNATDISSPLLSELKLIPVVESMIKRGECYYTDRHRGVHIELIPYDIGISEIKQNTALYRLTRGTRFYDHALKNNFAYNSFSGVEKRNIKNYKPLVNIGGIYIYAEKTTAIWYACESQAKCPYSFTGEQINLFVKQYGPLLYAKMHSGNMGYSSYEIKDKLANLLPNNPISVKWYESDYTSSKIK